MNSGYDNTYGSDDGSDLVKDLRKQLKEQSARFKELEEELTGFKSSARTNELSAALQEAGYPETVARFVPDDLSTEDLNEWLEENGAVFTKSSDFEAAAEAATSEETTPPAEVVAETKKVNNIAEAAIPVGKMEEFSRRIEQAESDEEISAIMQEAKKFVL